MDFFDNECQTPPINHKIFGICDDENGGKAYTNVSDENIWIATVKNNKKLALTFTAIDKCVIKDDEEKGRGRCDGMLTSSEHIYLVELKNRGKDSISGAIDQLESTIQFLIKYHPEELEKFRHKKAFACNRRKRHFQVIDNERNLKFFKTYGFRIDVQAEILVV